MRWGKLTYTLDQVNQAGRVLVAGESATTDMEWYDARTIIDNWRSAHHYPLNNFQLLLRRYARLVDPHSVVVQRIKRLRSIDYKLRSNKIGLTLSEMQDIGGCRAVVSTLAKLNELVRRFENTRTPHQLDYKNDYVGDPKGRSGYRGIHLIYKHRSKAHPEYNDFRIELQLRTSLQHMWATTVEMIDRHTGQRLKSSAGQKDWQKFFKLMSAEFAHLEKTRPVPGVPGERKALVQRICEVADELRAEPILSGITTTLEHIKKTKSKAKYFVIALDPVKRVLTRRDYLKRDRAQADKDLHRIEEEQPNLDAVLISSDRIADLERGYPNYLGDAKLFLAQLRAILGRKNEASNS